MKRISLIALVFCLVAPGYSYAEAAATGPKDNGLGYFLTETVYPVDKGQLQTLWIPIFAYSSLRSDFLFSPQFYYGLTDRWQIILDLIPVDVHHDNQVGTTSGPGDTDIATEYSWINICKSNWSAALLFDLHLPTGNINKNLTDGLLRYNPYLLLSVDFPQKKFRYQVFSQIGFNIVQRVKRHQIPGLDLPAAHYFVLDIGVAMRTEKVNYSIEINWFTNNWNNGGNDNELYVAPGVNYQISDNVALGLALPIGLTKQSYNFEIVGILQINFDTIFKKKESKDKDEDKNKDKKNKSTTKKKSHHATRTRLAWLDDFIP